MPKLWMPALPSSLHLQHEIPDFMSQPKAAQQHFALFVFFFQDTDSRQHQVRLMWKCNPRLMYVKVLYHKKSKRSNDSHSSLKLKKKFMSLKYTPVSQSILFLIFLMYVKTIQCLNYGGQESKIQFVVYDSDTPVTLKQGQGHLTWYE